MIRGISILAMAIALSSAADAETLQLKTGASTEITLSENPSTGYSWRIDEASSTGVGAVVAIVDRGHAQPASKPGAPPLVGAPGTHRWTIRALKAGEATIVLNYQRPWEPQAVETRTYQLTVAP